MMLGMTRAKIAVSLPVELVAAARSAVRRGRAASVSGYVETALAAQVAADDTAWLDQMLEESGGALSADEIAWADAVLGG